MRQSKVVFTLALLFAFNLAIAQQVENPQIGVAKSFLKFMLKGQVDDAWQLIDKTHLSGLTKEEFNSTLSHIKKQLALFDSFDLVMNGTKMVDNNELSLYTFKAISTGKNVVDDVSIDVIFFDSCRFVAGVQPKQLLKENAASTTKAKETPLEQNFNAVINGTTYQIKGINIVHFENNKGLLAIQVEMKFPKDDSKIQEWGQKEAVKFAKYLIAKGYFEKAKIKSKEIDRVLLDEIGVSFFDSGIGGGFNVMLKPAEYK